MSGESVNVIDNNSVMVKQRYQYSINNNCVNKYEQNWWYKDVLKKRPWEKVLLNGPLGYITEVDELNKTVKFNTSGKSIPINNENPSEYDRFWFVTENREQLFEKNEDAQAALENIRKERAAEIEKKTPLSTSEVNKNITSTSTSTSAGGGKKRRKFNKPKSFRTKSSLKKRRKLTKRGY